ncbi:unnamed protein product [Protopolystoma xenopodis]|uniref:Uncharacterized protein n=1 Tax=Protopolystoma xenopodis TaxID=117903 RepID=A0A448WB97_9PLAT|nr:unnamed protein product [Protopolystoma xenopodis]
MAQIELHCLFIPAPQLRELVSLCIRTVPEERPNISYIAYVSKKMHERLNGSQAAGIMVTQSPIHTQQAASPLKPANRSFGTPVLPSSLQVQSSGEPVSHTLHMPPGIKGSADPSSNTFFTSG